MTTLKSKASKDIEDLDDLSKRRAIGDNGDFEIGEHLETAILYMLQGFWGAVAA